MRLMRSVSSWGGVSAIEQNKLYFYIYFNSLLFRKTQELTIILTILSIVLDEHVILATCIINFDKESRRPSSR
jgi:hypothetical protein